MIMHDFSKYKVNNKFYGGSEKKIGIEIDGISYMLKFQKKTPFGYRYNIISEYLGSHIYQMLGFDCQDTYLGKFKDEYVVCCKDFITKWIEFVPFNDVGESSLEVNKELYQYEYNDIMELLISNSKLTNIESTISLFFEMFVVDAFLGNFDRHGGNWGFLKENNKYKLAPIFDNGSCLYPNMTNEDEMKLIISNEDEIDKRIYNFPTSQIRLNGKKSSYYDVISSLEYDNMNKALLKIFPLIDLEKINTLIDEIYIISNIHKEFYKVMLKNRYEKILKYSYLKLVNRNERI